MYFEHHSVVPVMWICQIEKNKVEEKEEVKGVGVQAQTAQGIYLMCHRTALLAMNAGVPVCQVHGPEATFLSHVAKLLLRLLLTASSPETLPCPQV